MESVLESLHVDLSTSTLERSIVTESGTGNVP